MVASNLSTEKKRIAILASGRGSNFEALCKAVQSGGLHAEIAALVCNVKGAGALEIARRFQIPTIVIESRGKTREQHESQVLEALKPLSPDWIVLAGYMRILTEKFIQNYWDAEKKVSRIVNIHPSLLPEFKGIDAYAQAHAKRVAQTGVTVHLVSLGVDEGPVVMQESFKVHAGESLESLTSRGLSIEHRIYPQALERLLHESWRCDDGKVVFEEQRRQRA